MCVKLLCSAATFELQSCISLNENLNNKVTFSSLSVMGFEWHLKKGKPTKLSSIKQHVQPGVCVCVLCSCGGLIVVSVQMRGVCVMGCCKTEASLFSASVKCYMLANDRHKVSSHL